MSATSVVDLRCEYLVNPLGLDEPKPRLSWKMRDARPGAKQTAYEITFDNGGWSSGKVASDQSTHVAYAGPELKSRTRCTWRVRIWDHEGKPSEWSEPAFFEMGLLTRNEWKAEWIGSPHAGGAYSIPPAPYLRKAFSLAKPIRQARLYISALGIYEAEINGSRVSDDLFLPGRTEYKKRVPYQTWDVTALLKSGDNAIGAILGDGWYAGHVHSDPRGCYGDRPKLLAQLVVDFNDGSQQIVATDSTWKSTIEGPVRSSDILMGEDYDARKELPAGWSSAGFDDTAWDGVKTFDEPSVALIAKRSTNVKRMRELKPVSHTISANKRRILLDLGQNMVGRVRLKIRNAPPGKVVSLRHVEMLDKNGKPYVEALRTARATDHYTCRGGPEEVFEPRFTWHGFRYVEVRDLPCPLEGDTVIGVVIHSDTPPTGTFECSDPMINQLQSNITWSQRGNFLEIPTDCPQRDERLGWTGDAQVFIRTAAFNMDVAAFFTHWLQVMADAQFENGGIPSTVPFCPSIPTEGGPAWSDAAVICPWTIYLCYGDTRILETAYPMMRKFVQYLQDTSPNDIRADETKKWRGYGDWLSQNADTAPDLIGTAFYAHCADLMSRIATVLGKAEHAGEYRALHERVRGVWRKRFVTLDGLIAGQTQTAYLLSLQFDLIQPELRAKVVDALVRDIRKRGMHLSTGFVGTPYLTQVLTREGHLDVAYALLEQKTFPSWLFPITHGATTMWERWDGWTPEKGFNDAGMNSYNHYAYGAVGDWMYATIAGIDLDREKPGYKHIVIAPRPGGTITGARASLKSIYGLIKSEWTLAADGTFNLRVTIPPNTTATVRLPSGKETAIEAGEHSFTEAKA